MSYTVYNFKTKKALKQAVTHYLEDKAQDKNSGEIKLYPVRCYNPGVGPDLSNFTGAVYLEGPHYPQPHKWYAQGEMKDGVLIKVK